MRDVVGKRLCSVLSVAIFIATIDLAIFNEGTNLSNYYSEDRNLLNLMNINALNKSKSYITNSV